MQRGWWWRIRRQQAALKCTELPDSTQTRPHRRDEDQSDEEEGGRGVLDNDDHKDHGPVDDGRDLNFTSVGRNKRIDSSTEIC